MPGKRFKAEEIVNKLRQADVELARGSTVAAVCKLLGITDATYFRWRKEYGGMKVDQAKRLKALEQEIARLKLLLADADLDKAILREASGSGRSGRTTCGRTTSCWPGRTRGCRFGSSWWWTIGRGSACRSTWRGSLARTTCWSGSRG